MLRTLLLSSSVLLTPVSAAAQNADEDIITVNATRLNQSAAEAGSSISVITAADIEALGYDFVIDAIAAVPGVTVSQNAPFGGQAAVRIRGAGSEQTLTLIDGVPVNDTSSPGGGYDFGQLDTDSIARIEVIKGAASTLWGSDAIGGVVNIITKRAEPGLGANAFAEYGSFDTKRGGVSISGANDIGDIRLGVTATDSDGNSKADSANGNTEHDGYTAYTLSGNGGLNIGAARIKASVIYTDADTDFDSFVFGAQGNVGDGDESAKSEELSAQINAQLPLFDGRLENSFLLGYSDIDRQNFAGDVPSFGAQGERNILRYQGTAALNTSNTLGFGYEREKTQSGADERVIDSLFALIETKPLDGLTVTAGVRNDDHSVYGAQTTLRASAAYQLAPELALRGSWGEGFKAPSLFQTTFFCCGASAPNAELRPETSDSYDFGLDFAHNNGRVRAGISVFSQDITDLITFSFGIGGYENTARANIEGFEIYGDYDVNDWVNIALDYAYIDARDGGGVALIRVPEHTGDVTLRLDPDGPLSGNVIARYSSDQSDSTGEIDGWIRLDATAAYAFSHRMEFYGRIENLLNADYQQVLGYGTPGLSGSIGIRVSY